MIIEVAIKGRNRRKILDELNYNYIPSVEASRLKRTKYKNGNAEILTYFGNKKMIETGKI